MLMFVVMFGSEIGFLPEKAYATSITKNGFVYDDSVYNTRWMEKESVCVTTSEGKILGKMTYYVGLSRRKGSNDWIVMYREAMEPNSSKVKINSYQSGYGLSEYLSVTSANLPSLDDYLPVNTPNKDKVSLSLGISGSGAGASANVSANYVITHNDLDITASCSTSTGKYYVKYDYKPGLVNLFASNKYVANESIQMGMAQFETKGLSDYVTIPVKYEVRFGAASNSKRSPAFIYVNYIRKASDSRVYQFKILK